jgi:hypothetical protein
VDSAAGEGRSEDCSGGVETAASLETSRAQCGADGLQARQCWDTGTYSSRQPEPVSVSPPWLEMASNGRGFANSNVMLVRNESSTDMSIVAMLASCSPVALQGSMHRRVPLFCS